MAKRKRKGHVYMCRGSGPAPEVLRLKILRRLPTQYLVILHGRRTIVHDNFLYQKISQALEVALAEAVARINKLLGRPFRDAAVVAEN